MRSGPPWSAPSTTVWPPRRTTPITAVAVTNQRESAVAWDRATGRPLGPCVVWQCRRTAPFCDGLRERGLGAAHRAANRPDDRSAVLREQIPLAARSDRRRSHAARRTATSASGTWTAGCSGISPAAPFTRATSTNASRTQLLNLTTGAWDAGPARIFRHSARPRFRTCGPRAGSSVRQLGVGRLRAGVPIAALIGDSHAALFGHAAFHAGVRQGDLRNGLVADDADGRARAVAGTDCRRPSRGRLPDRIAYALEGNITTTGGAVDWLGALAWPVRDRRRGRRPRRQRARQPTASTWCRHSPGSARRTGMPTRAASSRAHARHDRAAHVARATIESIAYQVRDVFDAMQRGRRRRRSRFCFADGGASRNETLMQFQADILGCRVVRRRSADLSAQGAAWLAGLATGVWASTDVLARPASDGRPLRADDGARRSAPAATPGGSTRSIARGDRPRAPRPESAS